MFSLKGRNPDILTSIANLSNDEVFTPPSLANQMLDQLEAAWAASNDGANLWADPTVRFLDPFTKSGVFPREITKRLVAGLADHIPDLEERVNHILSKQVFGIAITQLTALMARRSVYCSKWADGPHSIARTFTNSDGNIWFEPTQHTWVNGKCIYCGASREMHERDEGLETHAYALIHADEPQSLLNETFGADVQFDVIIGNPPYQLADGGGTGASAMPIYNLFVEQAKKLEPRYLSMIIPARWFTGGKGLDEFRESMLGDNRIRLIEDYIIASDVFPNVALKGGVCYFIWDRDNPGPCQITTHLQNDRQSTSVRPLLEQGADVFIRFNEGLSILRKVMAVENPGVDSLALPEKKRFEQLVSSRRPFGFNSTFRGRTTGSKNDVLVYQNGGTAYTTRSSVTAGGDLIDRWKLFVGFAAPGTGNKDTFPHKIISTPFVGEPGSVSSETYLCIGPFATEEQAKSALSYLSCRLVRFLILLHKPSHNTTRRVYTFVPTQKWNRKWTDADLYKKYGLASEEVAFIESLVRPMELTDE